MGLFKMPSLGADMDEGTLLEWLVKPGDAVHKGDVVAVIDTAKSAIDVEVFEDGFVGELLIEPGTLVPVGTPLARIDGDATAAEPQEPPLPPEPEPEPSPPPQSAPRLTPPVRHLMHQFGLDTGDVVGTGPQGSITRKDVLAAAGESSAGGPPVAVEPPASPAPSRARVTPRARRLAAKRGVDLGTLTGAQVVTGQDVESATPQPKVDRTAAMRAATAALMSRAAREIPHYYVVSTYDITETLEWLRDFNAGRKPRERVLPAALFLRAAVIAAVEVPALNGHWEQEFVAAEGVDLGVAVATRAGGLVTPRVVGAQALDLAGLMTHLTDLVKRAKAGRLKASELLPGSITVSSLADGGPDVLYGVIYPPQVALVGVGAVAPRPWVVDGEVVVRSTVTVTLAADHRATDGRTGARFLTAFGHALTHPEEL
ncbi:MAG: 2-oxo acid dehydrogenase subunit E2 [Candidatus Nanopelagicales bacterium]|nr:2-oxo acid dehydrogenase subunit E2 [Candidatus Nanopelagicales bacterium]